ncbi:DNA cytosine methyltransferase [Thalassococcus lentus]|uniref:DNA cytosine methyltransferase n=1 Tax=Thalassococcus lentus TaxID=1210524 RepID=A0ABT4XY04_9RHOB|nr:DNA cytosine methyltransferase [Thalassococcus lentus]MDA7426762.1 DNA cytosine methyltransferase [Thalassococcus lentus]
MVAWYNDTDPYAAQWLQNLIDAGHIAPGVVDTRDIRDISPNDLTQYTQLHFFAGIGGWSLALRAAGWTDNRPVWTGSCPCQPFSNSGQQKAFDDDRHLWPVWFELIKALKPATLFGEQVAAKAALDWFDLVSADLEGAGYAVGATDLCAAGLAAPHIRQRLWFGATRRMADANGAFGDSELSDAAAILQATESAPADQPARPGDDVGLGDAHGTRSQGRPRKPRADQRALGTSGLDRCPWREPEWIWCRDGRWRSVEPGLRPLAHGVSNRVGRLRAYGNAIVPQVAASFIEAFEESL